MDLGAARIKPDMLYHNPRVRLDWRTSSERFTSLGVSPNDRLPRWRPIVPSAKAADACRRGDIKTVIDFTV
jgi:hypothetical protein